MQLFSVILIAFCISLYFPCWYKFIYITLTKNNKRIVFNTILNLLSVFIPTFIFIIFSTTLHNKDKLISNILPSMIDSEVNIIFLLLLIISYIALFILIAFFQKKQQIQTIDSFF